VSSRLGRIVKALARVSLVLILGIAAYAGLVQFGLIRSPFAGVVSGDIALARSDRAGLRVLFVGNSFTSENSLPSLVHQLAAGDEGATPIFAVGFTAGGSTLRRASHDDVLTALLKDVRWDDVVLQEQSQIPSFSREQRQRELYPFARSLHTEIAAGGARTILFMTWGYARGDRAHVRGDTFAGMQARLSRGYSDLAAQLPASIAPVGLAWEEALRHEPGLDLWAGDGKHPSRVGSFLAACVLYALLEHRDPAGSQFTAGLGRARARLLQRVARDVVG
jgi:hypothetical protein